MKRIVCLMVVCGIAASVSAGTVIYRENFTVDQNLPDTTDNGSLGSIVSGYGWTGYANSNCQAKDATGWYYGGGSEPRNWTEGSIGAPTPGSSINAGPDQSDLANGWLMGYDGSGNAGPWLVYTEEYTVTDPIESVSFYLTQLDRGGTPPEDAMRVAVRVGTQWYVSDQGWDDPNEAAGNWNENMAIGGHNPIYCELMFADATWKKLTVDPGISLALGDSAVLPDGDVTAFGTFYVPSSTGQFRNSFDTYQITVPEPATMSVLAIGGLAALIRRRKK